MGENGLQGAILPRIARCLPRSAPAQTIRLPSWLKIAFMEPSLTDLEFKLNLAEDAIDALNRALFRQQQQIDLLQAQLRELYLQSQATDAAAADTANNPILDPRAEIPPHY
jgi:SlyX protein